MSEKLHTIEEVAFKALFEDAFKESKRNEEKSMTEGAIKDLQSKITEINDEINKLIANHPTDADVSTERIFMKTLKRLHQQRQKLINDFRP